MGNWFSGGSSNKAAGYPIIDFDNPKPNEADQELFTSLREFVQRFPQIIQAFSEYQGSGQLIRAAISNPSAETETAAWGGVKGGVGQLRDFFEMSTLLERNLPKLYSALCVGEADAALTQHQALAKLLCEMLDFCMRFDDMKMINPAVQNDLAYYRRVLSRLKRERKVADGEIRDEVVDRMSLFYAHASPMSRVIIETTTHFLESGASASAGQINKVFARLAESCRGMVSDNKIPSPDTQQLCLRSMTTSLVILDHINPGGIFTKKSPVDIVSCIKLLQNWKTHNTDALMNALRFMTVHAREPNVLGFIKKTLW